MTKILHIVECLTSGGGPRALIAAAKYSSGLGAFQHHIISLYPVDPTAFELAKESGIAVMVPPDRNSLLREIESSDIVHLSWWNSPKNYELLRSELPAMRLLIWFHVAGDSVPQIITPKLVDFADFALACSPYTYERPAIKNLPPEVGLEKAGMVYGAADFSRLADVELKPHDTFNIGYIGMATFVKIHRDYVSMSAAINIPNARFVVCGFIDDILRQQAQELGVAERFDFRGYVNDIKTVYEILDVFGYPLCENSYAAAELTLQEAMYAGIPPVVFPSGGIRELVVNDYTGLIVHNELEYKQAIEYLYHHPEERKRMGRNAREYARQIFGAENAAKKLNPIYEKMMQGPKRKRLWSSTPTLSLLDQPVSLQDLTNEEQNKQRFSNAEKFIESLGDAAQNFIASMNSQDIQALFSADREIASSPPVMCCPNTGGIIHYRDYYPDDGYLHLWAGLVCQHLGQHSAASSEFTAAKDLGCDHWRVNWYLAQSAEKAGDLILAKKSLNTVLQAAPEFTEAQEMSRRIGEIKIGKEDGAEKFSTQCPHCGEMLYIDHHGTWQCPRCKRDFVV